LWFIKSITTITIIVTDIKETTTGIIHVPNIAIKGVAIMNPATGEGTIIEIADIIDIVLL
jgi:hypothetical protein